MSPAVLASGARMARAAELQVVHTHNVGDIVITLFSPAGEWAIGRNRFVLEFDSALQKRLIDADMPTLMATLSGSLGNPQLRVPARLERGDVPGRYFGAVTLARAGEWEVAADDVVENQSWSWR